MEVDKPEVWPVEPYPVYRDVTIYSYAGDYFWAARHTCVKLLATKRNFWIG